MMSCWRCLGPFSPALAVMVALLAYGWGVFPTQNEPMARLKYQEPVEQEAIVFDEDTGDEESGILVTLTPAPNFSELGLNATRKEAFIAWLLPLIGQENASIATQRKEAVRLYALWQEHKLSLAQKEWLVSVATDYEVEIDRKKTFTVTFWQVLLHRLDIVPPSLVLTQAAIETGWGTSRSAKMANNFFGLMCFTKGCGLESPGIAGDFRRYESPQASVAAYMHILNTKGAYRAARMERMRNRLVGEVPSGLVLAKKLLNYSELGQRYVNFLIHVMQDNQLENYDGADVQTSIQVLAAPPNVNLNTEKVE